MTTPDAQQLAMTLARFTLNLDHWAGDLADETVKQLQVELLHNGLHLRPYDAEVAQTAAKLAVTLTLREILKILGEEALVKISKSTYDDDPG